MVELRVKENCYVELYDASDPSKGCVRVVDEGQTFKCTKKEAEEHYIKDGLCEYAKTEVIDEVDEEIEEKEETPKKSVVRRR